MLAILLLDESQRGLWLHVSNKFVKYINYIHKQLRED